MMKKLLCLLLAVLMLLSLCACGGDTDGGTGDGGEDAYIDKYSSRPKTVTLCYYEGGYGIQWLRAVAADYMDNINTDVYISFKASTDNSVAREKITT